MNTKEMFQNSSRIKDPIFVDFCNNCAVPSYAHDSHMFVRAMGRRRRNHERVGTRRDSSKGKALQLNLLGGRKFQEKVQLLSKKKNSITISSCFTTLPSNKRLISYPPSMEQYMEKFKSHSQLNDYNFVIDDEKRILRMEELNHSFLNKRKKEKVGAVSFSGGVDSTWLSLYLILEKKIRTLYLFHAKNINQGGVGEREKKSAGILLEQLQNYDVEVFLIEIVVDIPFKKQYNIDRKNLLEISHKNQLILKEMVDYIFMNRLLVSTIFYNCDDDSSTYFSDNREAFQSFQPIIDHMINYKIELREIIATKQEKVKLLMEHNLFFDTSFCIRANYYGVYPRCLKLYLYDCKEKGIEPFNKTSCASCDKCKTYKIIYDNLV